MVSNRIIAFCLTAVTLFSSVSFASAAEASNAATFANGSFWDQILIGLVTGTVEWPFGDIVQDVAAVVSGEVCPDSSDGLHRTSRAGLLGRPSGFDLGVGRYGMAICDYCGEEFKIYSQDLSERGEGFTQAVKDKYGTTGINSSGLPVYYPTEWNMEPSNKASLDDLVSFGGGFVCEVIATASGTSYLSFYSEAFVLPSGQYELSLVSYSGLPYTDFNLQGLHNSGSWTNLTSGSSPVSFDSGGWPSYRISCSAKLDSSIVGASYSCERYFIIECLSLNSGTVFSPPVAESRPAFLDCNYGIIGDNGSLTKVDATTIVNESISSYYNPVTNTSYDLSGWTYDYSTRTYNLTTADDNSVTVTYGDENVTINEGDDTYNVYYLVETPESDEDDSGSGAPGVGEDHTHSHTSEITTAASCLLPGVRTYSCSCGDTYTKSVPATGHAWAVSQQVNTTYDPDTGELLQQGYTVYVCNTCGDQYRDDTGTGPPNGSSGNTSGESVWDKLGNLLGGVVEGFLSLLDGLLGGLLDGMISLLETVFAKLTRVVEIVTSMFAEIPALFGGFLDLLGAVFPFIPEDMMIILTFGLFGVVAVGLWKAFRR